MITSFLSKIPKVGRNAYIAETAIVIGNVELGAESSIWPQAVVRGDVNRIVIGAETNIQDGSVLHVTQDSHFQPGGWPLLVGHGVTVGHRAVLHGCTIGDLCLIGVGAIVMDGAIVEDRVLLGAGALVPPGKRLASGWLYVGSPARPVRELNAKEREFLEFSKNGYVMLKNTYMAG